MTFGSYATSLIFEWPYWPLSPNDSGIKFSGLPQGRWPRNPLWPPVGLTVWSVRGGRTIVFSMVFMTSFHNSFSTLFSTVFSQILAKRVRLEARGRSER